jgi:hypothetical protein
MNFSDIVNERLDTARFGGVFGSFFGADLPTVQKGAYQTKSVVSIPNTLVPDGKVDPGLKSGIQAVIVTKELTGPTAGANLRSKAGTDGAIVMGIPRASVVLLSGPGVQGTGSALWFPVNFGGTKGYIAGEYMKALVEAAPTVAPTATVSPAPQMPVPPSAAQALGGLASLLTGGSAAPPTPSGSPTPPFVGPIPHVASTAPFPATMPPPVAAAPSAAVQAAMGPYAPDYVPPHLQMGMLGNTVAFVKEHWLLSTLTVAGLAWLGLSYADMDGK